jgi:hypothetical protein
MKVNIFFNSQIIFISKFAVLSDPKKKTIYDQFGYSSLAQFEDEENEKEEAKNNAESKSTRKIAEIDERTAKLVVSFSLLLLIPLLFVLVHDVREKGIYWELIIIGSFACIIYAIFIKYFDDYLKNTRNKTHETDAIKETLLIHILFKTPFEDHSLGFLCVFHFVQFMVIPWRITALSLERVWERLWWY